MVLALVSEGFCSAALQNAPSTCCYSGPFAHFTHHCGPTSQTVDQHLVLIFVMTLVQVLVLDLAPPTLMAGTNLRQSSDSAGSWLVKLITSQQRDQISLVPLAANLGQTGLTGL